MGSTWRVRDGLNGSGECGSALNEGGEYETDLRGAGWPERGAAVWDRHATAEWA